MDYYVDSNEIPDKIKDNEYDNIELNNILHWSINKNYTEIFDIIWNNKNFDLIDEKITINHFISLVDNNDIKRFKLLLSIFNINLFNNLMPGILANKICLENKIEFLKIIINLPHINFTVAIKKSFHLGNYTIVSMLLQRPEIKNNKELFDKYNFILRARKIVDIKNKIKL